MAVRKITEWSVVECCGVLWSAWSARSAVQCCGLLWNAVEWSGERVVSEWVSEWVRHRLITRTSILGYGE